jgi:hypothetical protein
VRRSISLEVESTRVTEASFAAEGQIIFTLATAEVKKVC